jgi:hypothetical protein
MDGGWSTDPILPRVLFVKMEFLGVEDTSWDAKDISEESPDYKDPDFYSTNGSPASSSSGILAGIMAAQQQTTSMLSALQGLGLSVGTSGSFTFNSSNLIGQSATALGLNLSQLGLGAGLPQIGGAVKF